MQFEANFKMLIALCKDVRTLYFTIPKNDLFEITFII